MPVDQNLVRGEGDQGAAAHRVMWHDGDDAAIVIAQRTSDLARRKDQAAGVCRMISIVFLSGVSRMACQHALRVVDVDVSSDWNAKERHGLLAMDQRDHCGVSF